MASVIRNKHREAVEKLAEALPWGTEVCDDDGMLVKIDVLTDEMRAHLRRYVVPRGFIEDGRVRLGHVAELRSKAWVAVDADDPVAAWDAAFAGAVRGLDKQEQEMRDRNRGADLVRVKWQLPNSVTLPLHGLGLVKVPVELPPEDPCPK